MKSPTTVQQKRILLLTVTKSFELKNPCPCLVRMARYRKKWIWYLYLNHINHSSIFSEYLARRA